MIQSAASAAASRGVTWRTNSMCPAFERNVHVNRSGVAKARLGMQRMPLQR
jgi:hypothetical protein